MEMPKLEKAYDVKVLGQRLKMLGLAEAEDFGVAAYAELDKWIEQSAMKSETPWDDIGVPFVKSTRPLVLEQIDKIDGVTPEDLNPVASDTIKLEKAYDFKVLIERLKLRGLKEVEDLARIVYEQLKTFLMESAPLSENPIDDIAAPFVMQLDPLVLPQIDKISA